MLKQYRLHRTEHGILRYLAAYWREHNYGPSQREVSLALDIPSRATVSRWYRDLELKGLIDRGPFGAARTTKPVVKATVRCPVCGRGAS